MLNEPKFKIGDMISLKNTDCVLKVTYRSQHPKYCSEENRLIWEYRIGIHSDLEIREDGVIRWWDESRFEDVKKIKLTLEQILEKYPERNFVGLCTVLLKPEEHVYPVKLFFNRPVCGKYGWEGTQEEHPLIFYIGSKLLDYSGDWRDSLRSREDIKNKGSEKICHETGSTGITVDMENTQLSDKIGQLKQKR